jgi:alpha-L-rhamnosidase
MAFTTGTIRDEYSTTRYPLQKTVISPSEIVKKSKGHFLIDFGKVAFGYLHLELESFGQRRKLQIHLGERGDLKGVNKRPGGTVRYHKIKQALKTGINKLDIHPARNVRNTLRPSAIKLPAEFGIVTPFRYVELVNCPVEIDKSMIQQISIHYRFREDESTFDSSEKILDDIWGLCKYSMKATSFCGVYVDGDRERIPYEADAYINQLSHYAVDREFSLARYSHEYLLTHPTWPTEWKQHSVMMAWADFMYTGNTRSLAENYEMLKTKTLADHAREDGLLKTNDLKDIVDWPRNERDNYEFKDVNTVVNAFYYLTLLKMDDIATALGKPSEAAEYQERAVKIKSIFNTIFFDPTQGVYLDGEGAIHASLHANMMALAFGLVPEDRKKSVTDFVVSKGMACSVYAAQYLLEGLYEGGRPDIALERMTSKALRSWYNMLRVGSTITLEAWDDKFKPNQDWNHAWGSVPGNIIPRYLMGIRPLEPGFKKVLIQPQPASLKQGSIRVPTIRGPITISFTNIPSQSFTLNINIPANMTAKVGLPCLDKQSTAIIVDGEKIDAQVIGGFLFVDKIGSGPHTFVAKKV